MGFILSFYKILSFMHAWAIYLLLVWKSRCTNIKDTKTFKHVKSETRYNHHYLCVYVCLNEPNIKSHTFNVNLLYYWRVIFKYIILHVWSLHFEKKQIQLKIELSFIISKIVKGLLRHATSSGWIFWSNKIFQKVQEKGGFFWDILII